MATITIPLEDKTVNNVKSIGVSAAWKIDEDLKQRSFACQYTSYEINCTVLATVTSGEPSPYVIGHFGRSSRLNPSDKIEFPIGTATDISAGKGSLRVGASAYQSLVASLTFYLTGGGGYTCAITQASITLTYDPKCYVTFEGVGISRRVDIVDSGTIPSYGSTPPAQNGCAFIGWKSSLTGQTYTGALPAATEQDVTYTAVYDGVSVTIDYLYAENGSNGYGSYYVDADDAFESGDDASSVYSNIMEGGGGECVNAQEETVVDSDAATVSAQAFIDDILQTYGLDISTGLVGITATGCTATWNAPDIELTDIQGDSVSLEVWFTDVAKTTEITDASLIYMGEQVGETNKVPTGQSYVISAEAVESKQQIERQTVPVTVNVYVIPDSSSQAVFNMPTADAAQQLYNILEGAPNMRTMYETVLSAGAPAYFASQTYEALELGTQIEIGSILSALYNQGASADFSAALAFNWSDGGVADIFSYESGSIYCDSGALRDNADHLAAYPVELLFC